MKFDIITLFPEMFSAIKEEGVIARAMKKSLISINTWQLRDFSSNKYKNVDEKPYGGGAGMVIQVKPIRDCISKIKQSSPNTKVIYLSPQGKKLDQNMVEELATFESITMLCGRYEGIDERIIENDIDFEISIGDYVISGGELAAMVVIDGISRCLPGDPIFDYTIVLRIITVFVSITPGIFRKLSIHILISVMFGALIITLMSYCPVIS